MRFFVFLLLGCAASSAQFLQIEQSFGGMEPCGSCSAFLEKKLTANPGVESVSVDAAKRLVKVVLKPGNTLRLSQVRDTVQQSGYSPNEARVTVCGTPTVNRGITDLKMPGHAQPLRIKDDEGHIREFTNKKVEIQGVVQLVRTGETTLEVLTTTKARLIP